MLVSGQFSPQPAHIPQPLVGIAPKVFVHTNGMRVLKNWVECDAKGQFVGLGVIAVQKMPFRTLIVP